MRAIRQPIHDFRLVFHCNYVSILHSFRDVIAHFPKISRMSRNPDHIHPG